MEGKVFSIEEFSTFDGPGIRMTVFLKGCPLRCLWCHNPEGQSAETEYMRNFNGWLYCGACERAGMRRNGQIVLTKESVLACSRNLIRKSGETFTAQALAEKILKNADILRKTGGGVTFSGGEPLLQTEFIIDCAKRLQNLSIALQTSGFAEKDVFKRALSVCDYVLYDVKLMDEGEHIRYCGGSNRNILQNYRILVASGKEFVTRVPLIPHITDREENLRAIAAFIKENGVNYVELLPYNKMAGSKYGSLMKEYPLKDGAAQNNPNAARIFEAMGVKVEIK
ncbi:MAG: glycyl-radical enzyme activating protein [Clostridia bacterium]|nr:glycyl-radical enzyme activating protein [Clostridia bacterium]